MIRLKRAGNFERPDVSILMTAYNTAPYVVEAIESVLHQDTSLTWELIFVDDGSTDNTLPLVKGVAQHLADRVRIFTHPHGANRGISASRNLALSHARGTYTAFLDSDDVWLPCHLDTLTSMLKQMPEITMIYGAAERWVDFSLPFVERMSRAATWGSNYLPPLVPAGETWGLLPRGKLLQWFRQDESMVPCICAVMLRTAAARDVGGFCEEFRGLYDDQAFHAKIARRYEIYAHDVCVARYRQHVTSCCAQARNDSEVEKRELDRFESFLRDGRDEVVARMTGRSTEQICNA